MQRLTDSGVLCGFPIYFQALFLIRLIDTTIPWSSGLAAKSKKTAKSAGAPSADECATICVPIHGLNKYLAGWTQTT
jgi:hypothetical protein